MRETSRFDTNSKGETAQRFQPISEKFAREQEKKTFGVNNPRSLCQVRETIYTSTEST